jgi:hypothetical protein
MHLPKDSNGMILDHVYLFEWAFDQYESGFCVESVHITLAGAYKAMKFTIFARWQLERNTQLMYGDGGFGYPPLEGERWRIRKIQLHI